MISVQLGTVHQHSIGAQVNVDNALGEPGHAILAD